MLDCSTLACFWMKSIFQTEPSVCSAVCRSSLSKSHVTSSAWDLTLSLQDPQLHVCEWTLCQEENATPVTLYCLQQTCAANRLQILLFLFASNWKITAVNRIHVVLMEVIVLFYFVENKQEKIREGERIQTAFCLHLKALQSTWTYFHSGC